MTNEGTVNLTDPRVQPRTGGNFERKPAKVFRPKEGETYRIRFPSGDVVMRLRHYNAKTKKYYRCLSYQGYCPVCVAASNKVNNIRRSTETYGANILVYDTEPDGTIKEPLNAEVYFWAFGSDKFVQLRSIIKEWGAIEDLDLQVTCTDGQFQKLTISPARKCLYNESGELFKNTCDQKLETDKYPLDKFICREVSLLDLVEAFDLDASYVPEDIRAQMGEEEVLAQDVAEESTDKKKDSPKPPEANFADLDSIQNLL